MQDVSISAQVRVNQEMNSRSFLFIYLIPLLLVTIMGDWKKNVFLMAAPFLHQAFGYEES